MKRHFVKIPSTDDPLQTGTMVINSSLPSFKDLSPVRMTVAGGGGVGKSALVVRYLTRRYIGEYTNNKCTLYYKTLDVRDYRVPMEVYDTDNDIIHLISREILLVIYSITDRSSLLRAGAILDNLRLKHNNHVLLLGNKLDLDHLREVYTSEGRILARQYDAQFSEISVSESSSDMCDLIDNVILQVWRGSGSDTSSRDQDSTDTCQARDKSRKQGVWSLLTTILGGYKGPGGSGAGSVVSERGRSSLPPDLG